MINSMGPESPVTQTPSFFTCERDIDRSSRSLSLNFAKYPAIFRANSPHVVLPLLSDQWTKLVAYPREPQPFIQRFKIGEIRGRMQPLFNVCDRLDVRQGRCEIVQCDLGPVAVPEACL